MNLEEQRQLFLQEYNDFQSAFQRGIDFFSGPEREATLVQARDHFFSGIGSTSELSTELYESISETFLEWFFFCYPAEADSSKTPCEIFMESETIAAKEREVLERASLSEWGIFERLEEKNGVTRLRNLVSGESCWIISLNEAISSNWRRGQILQSRFYPFFGQDLGFFSQAWIHPQGEKALLETICDERRERLLNHEDFMLAAFQALLRTRFLQDQLGASRSQNWLYETLWKRYA